ncbi:MAG: hypothetical protein IT376_02620 [Polyangiaceae bacterium]|nr:hypothetical protein [Polyangiaceae bacterium]
MKVFARALTPRGFFRCGRHWSCDGSVHDVSPAEFGVLKAEPQLQNVAEVKKPVKGEPVKGEPDGIRDDG